MNLKIAVVLLFAFVAASQAGFAVVTSYSESNCDPESVIALFISNSPSLCPPPLPSTGKRAIEQTDLSCNNETTTGYYYTVDTTYCENTTIPSVPSTYQVLQLSSESTCNATAEESFISFLAAPKDFSNGSVMLVDPSNGYIAKTNTSMACDVTSGNITATACYSAQACFHFNVANNECSLDTSSTFYTLQTTCTVFVPVSPPVAAPQSGPVASPVASVKTPAKTSSASIVYGSVALLSVIALF